MHAIALPPGDLWVYGYGSLIWRPGFEYVDACPARIYGYRRAALERFVELPRGHLEKREKLEQLRALEDGMRIDVGIVREVPFGVDTPADLERARKSLS